MAQTAKGQEPSMEEVLTSTRQIVADEESKPRVPWEPPNAVARPGCAAVPLEMPESAPALAPARSTLRTKSMQSFSTWGQWRSTTIAKPTTERVAELLDLTKSMSGPPAQPPLFHAIEEQSDVAGAAFGGLLE
jgi:hypothetical protein